MENTALWNKVNLGNRSTLCRKGGAYLFLKINILLTLPSVLSRRKLRAGGAGWCQLGSPWHVCSAALTGKQIAACFVIPGICLSLDFIALAFYIVYPRIWARS